MSLNDACCSTAEEYLSFAFQRCHMRARKNKRLILIYLLPVKMLLVCCICLSFSLLCKLIKMLKKILVACVKLSRILWTKKVWRWWWCR